VQVDEGKPQSYEGDIGAATTALASAAMSSVDPPAAEGSGRAEHVAALAAALGAAEQASAGKAGQARPVPVEAVGATHEE